MKAKVSLGTSVVVADIVSENEKSIRVMLPNGKTVKRKKNRDVLEIIAEGKDEGDHEDRRVHDQTDAEYL